MPILLTACLAALLVAYLATFPYRFVRNVLLARRTGFTSVFVPWDQNHFVWLVSAVVLRPWLKRHLPTWLYGRLVLTTYCHEFQERLRPFEEYTRRDPDGRSEKSYMLVTCAKYPEFWTYDSEITTQILARPADFCQIEISEPFMGRFGRNVLISNGEHWARQRRIVASVINERISKATFQESLKQVDGMLREVEKLGDSNRVFDMLRKVTIHVLNGVGMGVDLPWEDDRMERARPGFKMNYIEAVKTVMENVTGPIILPGWFLANYPSFLPGHRNLKSLSYAVKEFPTHTMAMLDHERRRAMGAKDNESRGNIMSQLLKASESDVEGRLSDDEMMGNLFIFTAAGFDTTANTLSYAVVLLARYPEWQEWLLEEIDALVSLSPPGADLEYAEIHPKAIRVLAFMHETLRLFPSITHHSKQTRTAITIQVPSGGTYCLPAKTQVYINSVALGLDPVAWRNLNLAPNEPPTADDELRFRPTRWLVAGEKDSSPTLYQPPKGTFIPWSAGPRICPGQKMAQVEFTAVLVGILRGYCIEAAASLDESRAQVEERIDEAVKRSYSVMTLQMGELYNVGEDTQKGLKMRLRKR